MIEEARRSLTIHDVAAFVVERHGPIDLAKLHVILFYINAWHMVRNGTPMFPDDAIAFPSGPVYPVLDVTVGKERWRRRVEARHGTRGRRGARRMPSMFALLRPGDIDNASAWLAEVS